MSTKFKQQQVEKKALTVRVLERSSEAATVLKSLEHVEEVVIDGELLRFEFAGDMKDQAELLAFLVARGFPVAECTSHRKSLEDVFLQVTRDWSSEGNDETDFFTRTLERTTLPAS